MTTKKQAPVEAPDAGSTEEKTEIAAEYAAVFAKLGADEGEEQGDERATSGVFHVPEASFDLQTLEVEIETSTTVEGELTASEGRADDAGFVEDEVEISATVGELKGVIEALLFVADEPLPFPHLCKVLGDVETGLVKAAIGELELEYEERNGGLELRELGGGWRISTRPQHHEFIRKYLKSKPSARLSLPALETLAVIAYKQPVTVPEILEIRGVTSTSAIKTLLEKRLIVTKGRKETVGRPMTYGTSKEFLIQFGLKDLNELPSIEDFEELAV